MEQTATVGEEWKSLEFMGYERHAVSSNGRVRGPRRLLYITERHTGYMAVALFKNGTTKSFSVHTLVAKAFLGTEQGKVIDHIDRNRGNNVLTNLRWVTTRENNLNRVVDVMKKARKPVEQIDLKTGNVIAAFDSAVTAGKTTGIDSSCIARTCAKDQMQSGGYGWRFRVEPDEMGEVWKCIHINGDDIHVSSTGRVKLRSGRVTRGGKSTAGYLRVTVHHKEQLVHRLVAHGFHNLDLDSGLVVDHLNFDKTDNRVENLSVTTIAGNNLHTWTKPIHRRSRRVQQLDINGEELRVFDKVSEAAKAVGVRAGTIYRVCNGWSASCKGYKWRYVDE